MSGAMFDVRPVDDTGAVAVVAFSLLPTKVNLRLKEKTGSAPARKVPAKAKMPAMAKMPEKEIFLKELQAVFAHHSDAQATLVSIGATVRHHTAPGRPRYRPVLPRPVQEQQHREALRAIRTPISHEPDAPSYDAPVDVQQMPAEAPMTTLVADVDPSLNAAGVDLWLDGARGRSAYATAPSRSVGGVLAQLMSRSLVPWILSAALVIAGCSRYLAMVCR